MMRCSEAGNGSRRRGYNEKEKQIMGVSSISPDSRVFREVMRERVTKGKI